MRFSEMIKELKTHGDVAVNCDWFVVPSLSDWIELNKSYVYDFVKLGGNPNQDHNCKRIKKNAEHLLEALADKTRIHPKGWRPNRFASIYPLK